MTQHHLFPGVSHFTLSRPSVKCAIDACLAANGLPSAAPPRENGACYATGSNSSKGRSSCSSSCTIDSHKANDSLNCSGKGGAVVAGVGSRSAWSACRSYVTYLSELSRESPQLRSGSGSCGGGGGSGASCSKQQRVRGASSGMTMEEKPKSQ